MILAIAEHRHNRVTRASWEAIAAAQALAASPLHLGVIGHDVAAVAQELAAACVGDVVAIEHPALATTTPDGFVAALDALVTRTHPDVVVMAHSYHARDVAPRAAARLSMGLISDVTAITGSGRTATFTRPVFQGKLAAHVKATGRAPVIVTIQSGAFRADAVRAVNASVSIEYLTIALDPRTIRYTPDAPFRDSKATVDLGQAERIVAVGRGIRSQDGLSVAAALATALRAELGASRPICDNGWLPMERQVGSSGQTVTPALYVALGISGAIQHVVGMKGARTIVAINLDAQAPIFDVADYGIVGDLFDIVPAIVAELDKG